LTWGDAASIRIKLTVPATQRHHHERAALARYFTSSVVLWTAYVCLSEVKASLSHTHTHTYIECGLRFLPQNRISYKWGYYSAPLYVNVFSRYVQ